MRRTLNCSYDIHIRPDVNESEVVQALERHLILDRAALAVSHSLRRVHGGLILQARDVIEAANPDWPDDAIDLPTLMAIMSGELQIDSTEIQLLRQVIPDYSRSRTHVKIRGNKNHVDVRFGVNFKHSDLTYEVCFEHFNNQPDTSLNGMFFPLGIAVTVWDSEPEKPKRRSSINCHDKSEFENGVIKSWINRVVWGLKETATA